MTATVIQLPTVESLSEDIRGLVYERQTMRAVGAGADVLERNRLELIHVQQNLIQALIRRYRPAYAA
jgi:hypothetical protein